jgi:macrolide-specific efflux system membrane fusion protein
MKRIVYWLIGIVIVGGAGGWGYYRYYYQAASPAYQDIRVTRGDLKVIVLTTGTVQPQNRLEIKPPIAGRIEEAIAKEGDKVQKGQVLAWMSSTERAALLDFARAKGSNELAHWEELYKATPLVAPIDGDIIARKIEPGQTVTASEALYVMSDRLIIGAQVDETDIGRIALNQPVDFTLDAYPHNVISGKVDQIAYEAKTVNNVTTYTVEVLPLAIPVYLRSGMTANLKVLTAAAEGVLLVPTEAVHKGKDQTCVWQPNPAGNGKPITTPVEIGLSDGKLTEIKSGLQEGDRVLLKGATTAAKETPERKKNPFLPTPPRRR